MIILYLLASHKYLNKYVMYVMYFKSIILNIDLFNIFKSVK